MGKTLGILALVAVISGAIYFSTPTVASAKVVPTKRGPTTEVNGIQWRNSYHRAVAEAKKADKPLLFLSMFGHIDEEMPCANARTLRATLFKDPEFMKLVGNEVIPAWEMVREVPRITIDLGDGKPIHRTVRGNAVMYLCNSDGKVIDVFPGVYTAEDFMPMIRDSIEKNAKAKDSEVIAYHVKTPLPEPKRRTEIRAVETKAILESPTLDLIGANSIYGARTESASLTSDAKRKLFLREAARIRDMSLSPMSANEAVESMTGKPISSFKPEELEKELLRVESERNTINLRRAIKLWFAAQNRLVEPEEARPDILENLLKIPYRDPQFGLADVLLPGTPR